LLQEFWEDDEEIRIGGRAGTVHFLHEEMRARNGDRVSFPRWEKRNVVSHHFTELFLEITKIRMLV